jgi:hypothetical protein
MIFIVLDSGLSISKILRETLLLDALFLGRDLDVFGPYLGRITK